MLPYRAANAAIGKLQPLLYSRPILLDQHCLVSTSFYREEWEEFSEQRRIINGFSQQIPIPNSFWMTAILRPWSSVRTWFRKVVYPISNCEEHTKVKSTFPAPKNPVKIVTGILAAVGSSVPSTSTSSSPSKIPALEHNRGVWTVYQVHPLVKGAPLHLSDFSKARKLPFQPNQVRTVVIACWSCQRRAGPETVKWG